jgi:flagellar hook-length control protein FliK
LLWRNCWARASRPQSTLTPGASERELDTDASDEAAALSLLPLPIGPMPPQVVQQQTQALDPLELLGLTAPPESASARDAALLQALTERLAAVDETPQEAHVSNGSLLPTIDVSQARSSAPEAAAASGRSLHSPVGTQAWADELGSRITMMTHRGEHTASLRLSPEHLGPLEIRIALRDDQASVWFGAAHADTRAAIEHALPRLRELFAAQGMSLADAGVSREPPRQQMPGFTSTGASDPATGVEPATSSGRVQVGLLDAYA